MYKSIIITCIGLCVTGCSINGNSDPIKASDLIGTWKCDSRTEAYLNANVVYTKTNQLFLKGTVRGLYNNEIIFYGMTVNGTWSIKNNKVYEKIDYVNLKGLNDISVKWQEEITESFSNELGVGLDVKESSNTKMKENETSNFFSEDCKKL